MRFGNGKTGRKLWSDLDDVKSTLLILVVYRPADDRLIGNFYEVKNSTTIASIGWHNVIRSQDLKLTQ